MRPVETINCTHVEPNGKACRRVAYRNLFYCHAHRHLYPDAKTRTDYVTRPKTWSEREEKHSPKSYRYGDAGTPGDVHTRISYRKQDADKGDERPEASTGPPPLLLIIGVIFAFWIFIKLAEGGFFDNMPSGNSCNGDICGLCLAPFAAGGAALSRSSTGKFTHDPSTPLQRHHTSLAKVTHCLHMDSLNGKKCRRMVMRQSGLCYQHQDSDAAEVFLEAIGRDASGDVLRYNVDGANKAVSSKDIDGLVEDLGKAKKFWVVDLGIDETEFVQFTYDGDIDDDGQRDGTEVFEHWRGGKMVFRVFSVPRMPEVRAIDRLRSMLTGEEPDLPENHACEETGYCEFDETGRCYYCFTYSPDWDNRSE